MQARGCRAKFTILIAIFSMMLTSCMVGPDFHSPASPRVRSYTRKNMPAKTVQTPSAGKSGQAQTFVYGRNIPAEWWYLFRSPEINQLITTGLSNSPNLASSYAALRAAQEALNAQIGNSLFPAFNVGLTGQRQRNSGVPIGTNTPSSIFNLFNASVSVSYTLDVFGGARRQIEGLRAQVDYQQFQLIAAYLTLTSNIVTTAVTVASLQEQIEATHELIQAQENQLLILEKQFRLGGISRENVLTQQTLVNQTRATLPPLEKSLSQSRHALLVLVGNFPNGPLPTIKLGALILPAELPVSLPSNLVRQRPDVRASEALLHAASALIGVATANLFPQFIINGNDGWESAVLSNLFNTSSKVWSISGGITQPLLHGGALLAQRRQAIAAYDQAAAEYRQTVLQAFQNVADTLRALEADARALRAQKRAENSARDNLYLTRKQYLLGGASYLSLLNAQQQYQTIRIAVIQAQAARYNDTAALFQALGGGWWNKAWCVKVSLNKETC
ncbi:MAG: efflux transporter outer membrane subunit [Gammaproteobacteria bacterium]|nr:efflux transporter outer membrane subunit [Gammaproteobacteria bacterium]